MQLVASTFTATNLSFQTKCQSCEQQKIEHETGIFILRRETAGVTQTSCARLVYFWLKVATSRSMPTSGLLSGPPRSGE